MIYSSRQFIACLPIHLSNSSNTFIAQGLFRCALNHSIISRKHPESLFILKTDHKDDFLYSHLCGTLRTGEDLDHMSGFLDFFHTILFWWQLLSFQMHASIRFECSFHHVASYREIARFWAKGKSWPYLYWRGKVRKERRRICIFWWFHTSSPEIKFFN